MTGPGSAAPQPEQSLSEETVPGESTPDAPATEGKTPAEAEWQRRKRLAAVFGDVLPDATKDERGPGSGAGTPDEWFRSQVPPHHG